jgi:predicted RNA-binding protein associated with RNAse of E/G family
MSRPGMDLVSLNDQVGLVPSVDLPENNRWWLATFHAPDAPRVSVYVDMTTPPRWDGSVLRTVDLDLDVIRLVGGEVFVDDEDEFAEHQVQLGYPRDVVARAKASRDRVRAAVRHEDPPFDGSHQTWQAVLDGLTARS